MAEWILNNTDVSENQVNFLFNVKRDEILDTFRPYPETAFHFDPVKYAELFAVEWGLKDKPYLEYVG